MKKKSSIDDGLREKRGLGSSFRFSIPNSGRRLMISASSFNWITVIALCICVISRKVFSLYSASAKFIFGAKMVQGSSA